MRQWWWLQTSHADKSNITISRRNIIIIKQIQPQPTYENTNKNESNSWKKKRQEEEAEESVQELCESAVYRNREERMRQSSSTHHKAITNSKRSRNQQKHEFNLKQQTKTQKKPNQILEKNSADHMRTGNRECGDDAKKPNLTSRIPAQRITKSTEKKPVINRHTNSTPKNFQNTNKTESNSCQQYEESAQE